MKVGLVIADINLRGGGERVAVNMANYFSKKYGYQVSIISIIKINTGPCFVLEENVSLESLELDYPKNLCENIIQKLYALRKLKRHKKVQELDCIIGIGTYSSCLVASVSQKGLKKVGTEHMSYLDVSALWKMIRTRTYPKLDHVVFLTEGDKIQFGGEYKSARVIPNCRSFLSEQPADVNNKQIINVGRLAPQKNQKQLVKVFYKLQKEFPDWRLKIVGEGALEKELKEQISTLRLNKKITILNGTEEILEQYMESSIFALTSNAEGLPMVMIEAQACGLPIVSVDCPTGPRDIIIDGEDGFLVPIENDDALICALRNLMESKKLRERMSRKARIRSEKFSPDKVFPLWKALIEG